MAGVQAGGSEPRDPGDPFFDVVRRRHPDVDIVLLPPDEPAPAQERIAPLRLEEAEDLASDLAGLIDNLWHQADLPTGEAPLVSWWAESAETARVEAALHAGGVDQVDGVRALATFERLLTDRGWRCSAPQDGMPRVLASTARAGVAWQLQASSAPQGRFALRLAAVDLPLAAEARAGLVGVAP